MSGHWEGLIILLSCAWATRTTQNRDLNPHTPVQQTWEVANEEGIIVWSITVVQPLWAWWPDLTADLCRLAAGSLTWDIPNHFDLQKPPAEKLCVPNGIRSTYGCSGQFYRANLRSAQFYVCPGQGHDRILRCKCVWGCSDFYCADWGCETKGDVYWNPSSTWDLITVKRNSTHDKPNQ